MPDLNCPHCRASLRVPDSLIGKKLRCKNENCRQPFVAQLEPIPRDPQPVSPAEISNLPPDWQQAMEGRQHEENLLERVKAHKASLNNGNSTLSNDSKEEQYPNLTKYLNLGRAVSRILLVLMCFVIVIATLVLFGGMVFMPASFIEKIGTIFLLVLVSAFCLGVAYLYYVFLMAGIEFIQVIIDVEKNTRMKNETLR